MWVDQRSSDGHPSHKSILRWMGWIIRPINQSINQSQRNAPARRPVRQHILDVVQQLRVRRHGCYRLARLPASPCACPAALLCDGMGWGWPTHALVVGYASCRRLLRCRFRPVVRKDKGTAFALHFVHRSIVDRLWIVHCDAIELDRQPIHPIPSIASSNLFLLEGDR